ncbi:MAG: aconitase family protein, partial [SAR324 cluster bacterium]|nr:aconitase family protein [SAR324 cluster bacterium]
MHQDPFNCLTQLNLPNAEAQFYSLPSLKVEGSTPLEKLPFSIRVLLEQALRNVDDFQVNQEDVRALACWKAGKKSEQEIPFKPTRVILQDFTGVPAVVDLAAMRSAMIELGGNPDLINPRVPVDLIIDHSVQVDVSASPDAVQKNMEIEFERNRERYQFLKWGQQSFEQ